MFASAILCYFFRNTNTNANGLLYTNRCVDSYVFSSFGLFSLPHAVRVQSVYHLSFFLFRFVLFFIVIFIFIFSIEMCVYAERTPAANNLITFYDI